MRLSLGDPSQVRSAVPPAAPATAPAGERVRTGASPFAQLVRGIDSELNRGEQMMRKAVDSIQGGSDFAPSQLIALQAGVYRYSEAIDLASRVVDRTTNGVKTVLQGSGQ